MGLDSMKNRLKEVFALHKTEMLVTAGIGFVIGAFFF